MNQNELKNTPLAASLEAPVMTPAKESVLIVGLESGKLKRVAEFASEIEKAALLYYMQQTIEEIKQQPLGVLSL